MSFTELFVIFVMAIIILQYIKQYYGEVHFVKAQTDGRQYLVRKLPDSQEAAEKLARLNQRLQKLVKHMVSKFGASHPDVQMLHENYNPAAVSEGGVEIGYTSYSVNKGEKIVMCLRQKDNSFVDDNILVYVAVHELGHLMTDEVGHTDKFWENFKFLLKEAVTLGIYTKVDFVNKPEAYCGISINSSVI
jgi:hypothetical protein